MSLLLPLLLRILTKAYKSFTFSSGMLRVPLSCLGWTPCFTICLGTHSPMASLAHFHSCSHSARHSRSHSFSHSSQQPSICRDSKIMNGARSLFSRLYSDSLQPPRPSLCPSMLLPCWRIMAQRCSYLRTLTRLTTSHPHMNIHEQSRELCQSSSAWGPHLSPDNFC